MDDASAAADQGPIELMPDKDRIHVDSPEEVEPAPGDQDSPKLNPIEMESDPYENWSPDGPAPLSTSGSCLNRGRYYVQLDAVYLMRSGPYQPVGLAVDLSSPTQQTLRTSPSLGYAPMLRGTFGALLGRDAKNRDHSIDFTYLGPGNWHVAQGIASLSPFGLVSLLDPSLSLGFSRASVYSYRYESNFNSYEINYRIRSRLGRDRMELSRDGTWVRKCAPMPVPAFFFGVRNVVINERFSMSAAGSNPSQLSGQYNINTQNNLLGVQGGFDVMYQYCDWRIGIRGKAGPYVNTTGQTSRVVVVDAFQGNPPDRNESAGTRTLGFLGEFNILGAYQIRSNLAIRASFDLLYVDQLALAPNQITFQIPVPPNVDHTAFLLYTGGSLGMEYVW